MTAASERRSVDAEALRAENYAGAVEALRRHVLLPWKRLPFPIPWREIFGRAAPLCVEVGFGDARFTVRRARAEPGVDFVGLEISNGSIQRGRARVARADVANVRLLKVGAEFAVRNLFGPGTIRTIVVNFPDPWPKAKHAEHRLLRDDFFRLAASRLAPEGEIRLATDHPDYFAFAREQAQAAGVFRLVDEEPPSDVYETKYALKWRAQGKPVHYQVFRSAAAPTQHPAPLERPETMPHALLRGRVPSDTPLEKTVAPYGGGHVILHEAARSLGDRAAEPGRRLLIRATVDEPDIRQQILVIAQQRATDEVIVRIGTFGDPVITDAVRGAVHLTAEWLIDRGGLAIEARNY